MKLQKFLKPNILAFVAMSITLVLLDIFTKFWVFKVLDLHFIETGQEYIQVAPFFNLVKVYNRGVSFGILNNLQSNVLILNTISVIVMAALLLSLHFKERVTNTYKWATLLIVSGACGNCIDRFISGAVSDFLDFFIKNHHFPAFNLADSLICVGVFLIIVDDFINTKALKK